MKIIVDSCVLISRMVLDDVNHSRARAFFDAAAARGHTLLSPATVLWDISARFVHPQKVKGDGVAADREFVIPVAFVPVTAELFFQNQQGHLRFDGRMLSVVRSAVRGPDHIFLSCALAERARVVTFDGKIHSDGRKFGVTVLTTERYLACDYGAETEPVPTHAEVFDAINRRAVTPEGSE